MALFIVAPVGFMSSAKCCLYLQIALPATKDSSSSKLFKSLARYQKLIEGYTITGVFFSCWLIVLVLLSGEKIIHGFCDLLPLALILALAVFVVCQHMLAREHLISLQSNLINSFADIVALRSDLFGNNFILILYK